MGSDSSTPPSSICSSHNDPRVQYTFDLVNWEALSSLACKLLNADSAHWGEQLSGGYNLVRFLHLHDREAKILVARVPLRSDSTMSPEHGSAISKRIASEVATMEYVETFTSIPVPHIFHHSADADGKVRSPYILMSKVAGVPLSSVVDILLELWSHRFRAMGVLFKHDEDNETKGKDAWYIESLSVLTDPDEIGSVHHLSTTSYRRAAEYWLDYATSKLHDISHHKFGSKSKNFQYAHVWFMRSLIPALFNTSLDAEGCPLLPADFHSQNIMVDVDLNIDHQQPTITSVIDWEFSGSVYVSSFAQYPLFIVDHPAWNADHPLRERNVQDQATFDSLIREAERNSPHTVAGVQLSSSFSRSRAIYLFQQAMCSPFMQGYAYSLLFGEVFGADEEGDDDDDSGDDDDDDTFSTEYYWALMEKGILREDRERFEQETGVWLEAKSILNGDVVTGNMSATEFREVILKNRDRFEEGGSVLAWLASTK